LGTFSFWAWVVGLLYATLYEGLPSAFPQTCTAVLLFVHCYQSLYC
jgi:hypothetical protein